MGLSTRGQAELRRETGTEVAQQASGIVYDDALTQIERQSGKRQHGVEIGQGCGVEGDHLDDDGADAALLVPGRVRRRRHDDAEIAVTPRGDRTAPR
jgi:hypothetical protein